MPKDKPVASTFIKAGVYYFERRVPADLQNQFVRNKVVFSLRTKCPKKANRLACSYRTRLEEYWISLRLSSFNNFPKNYSKVSGAQTLARSQNPIPDYSISQACNIYLNNKGANRPDTFATASKRACRYLREAIGDKTIGNIKRADAIVFRDFLKGKCLAGSSINRIFGTIKAIVNFTINEAGLDISNPFQGVYIASYEGTVDRRPFSEAELRRLQALCFQTDDDLRQMVALISDTGMRLSEALGLLKTDLVLNGKYPHCLIRPNNIRRLKNKNSTRTIPLVGAALQAATSLNLERTNAEFVFLRYVKNGRCNANSASATLNKWLQGNDFRGLTIHSLRHSFRDRLRAIECPVEIANELGGWANKGVGSQYGLGYPLSVLHKWTAAAIQGISPEGG